MVRYSALFNDDDMQKTFINSVRKKAKKRELIKNIKEHDAQDPEQEKEEILQSLIEIIRNNRN